MEPKSFLQDTPNTHTLENYLSGQCLYSLHINSPHMSHQYSAKMWGQKKFTISTPAEIVVQRENNSERGDREGAEKSQARQRQKSETSGELLFASFFDDELQRKCDAWVDEHEMHA